MRNKRLMALCLGWAWLVILIGLAEGCTSVRYIPVENTTVETVDVHDTSVVVKLVESHDTIAAPDTVSHLVNLYADSWARWEGGLLHHSLNILPGACMVVEVPQYMTRTRTVVKNKIVEVEKNLSKRQRALIGMGKALPVSVFVNIALIALIVWMRKKSGGL